MFIVRTIYEADMMGSTFGLAARPMPTEGEFPSLAGQLVILPPESPVKLIESLKRLDPPAMVKVPKFPGAAGVAKFVEADRNDSRDDASIKSEVMAIVESTPYWRGRLEPNYRTIAQLMAEFPELRPAVVHGLCRRGEVVNVIGSSKTMKTFFAALLVICIATGRAFLNHFRTEKTRVLYLDNELHPETAAFRFNQILVAMGLTHEEIGDQLVIENFRGRLISLDELDAYLRQVGRDFGVIVIDALYKFLPPGTDENDNGAMGAIYCMLDAFTEMTGATIIVIHHASKGVQGNKSATDVGAGAGAISRSPDSHLILRAHEVENALVFEGETRSFAKMVPTCIEWKFPLFQLAPELDPAQIKVERRGRGGRPVKDATAGPKDTPHVWTPEEFATAFITSDAKPRGLVLAKAQAVISKNAAEKLLMLAVDQQLIFRHKIKGENTTFYANQEQTLFEGVSITPDTPSTPGNRQDTPAVTPETGFQDTHTHKRSKKKRGKK